ncbi:bifunctional phosphoribosyl-AMP cyclohydrolase/phosphoribosyl-ATP diphosphatase HisIE [Algicola sagamiensis]|uniref:bifunctional phosphoribosyl-AMP cyclohydrolase/phosphoribosyl-ATP diphosphatase HisIE n=1 Tax=Algicola sagamiensis TaxID=163869 RepID=UPI000363AE81|nr:bifunctional phosphoribosyl-AMP cyclohydrolase/phosphoribosyl-ATP diphosphatase HisIE [Algicola sagamiensis]
MTFTTDILSEIDFEKGDGLIPVIAQDADTAQVLMCGFANFAAIQTTCETGYLTFYSRTKQRLWTKGESSGNRLEIVDLSLDCDNDSVLARVRPAGPTCHLGSYTCWQEDKSTSYQVLTELESTIRSRRNTDSKISYTAALFESGIAKVAQKVGEEGVEVALAAVCESDENLLNESADLLFHLMVVLQSRDLSLDQVLQILKNRANQS